MYPSLYCAWFNHIKTVIWVPCLSIPIAENYRGRFWYACMNVPDTFTPCPLIFFIISGEHFFMNAKNIAMGSISAGFILLIIMVISGYLVNMVLPTDISRYGGMRAMNDPVMNLFYLYPFVIASAAAIIFDIVKGCLNSTPVRKGLMYGVMLICIMTVPSLYVMYTSMTWPADFYVSTLIWEIISFPLMGITYARIWNI
jgi:hypothetical protein